MTSKRIMIVFLSVVPDRMSNFDDFYHHTYMPGFLNAMPEVVTARRFAPMNLLESIDPTNAKFLTIYQLAVDDSINQIEDGIKKWGNTDTSQRFKKWKEDGITYFDRGFFEEIYHHTRTTQDGSWSNRPFLGYMWTANSKNVEQWYHESYLSLLMADVPSWISCRTYERLNCEQRDFLTVFEAADICSLTTALQDINSPHRVSENTSLFKWQSEFVSNHTLIPYRLIYKLPD